VGPRRDRELTCARDREGVNQGLRVGLSRKNVGKKDTFFRLGDGPTRPTKKSFKEWNIVAIGILKQTTQKLG
jgi:hypothetical protein